MNSLGNALPAARIWQPMVLYACLALGCASVCAAPHQSAVPAPAAQPDMMDDLQPTTAKDLQLTPDNERKADALLNFIQGSMAEENADTDAALAAYRKVLATDPAAKVREDEDGDTLMLLSAKVAFELAQRGDPAAGIDLLKDAIKASPKDAMAYFFLSQLYEKSLNKYDVALKYAGQALDIEPGNFTFYVQNYELQLDLGQTKKADEILDRASKVQSDDPKFWLDLSELYIHATVKDNTPIAPDDLKKMDALFQKTVMLAKDDPFVLAKVADFDLLTQQVKEAIPLYQKALDLKGDSTDPELIEARENLAESLAATGKRDDAIKVLEDLVKVDPLNFNAYESLGDKYREKQDYDRALTNYQQSMLLNPGDPRYYGPVMGLMIRLKKYDQAVNLMTEAHRRFPDLPRITYHLALALTAAKKNQEAMAAFAEAEADAQTSDSDMLDAEFYYYYGSAAGQAGMIDKASELLQKAIKLDPEGKSLAPSPGEAYNDLGFLWVDHDQNIDKAGDYIKQALQMEPDNPAYIDSLGWYYFKKGDMDKALDQLLKAAEATKPEDPEVDDHVAETYQKLGKIPQALNYWQKAIALDPDNKDIAKKIEAAKQKATVAPVATPAATPEPVNAEMKSPVQH